MENDQKMENDKKTDRLQGQAGARENGNNANKANIATTHRDERIAQGTKEFEKGQSKTASSPEPKKLGDETEIEDESTI